MIFIVCRHFKWGICAKSFPKTTKNLKPGCGGILTEWFFAVRVPHSNWGGGIFGIRGGILTFILTVYIYHKDLYQLPKPTKKSYIFSTFLNQLIWPWHHSYTPARAPPSPAARGPALLCSSKIRPRCITVGSTKLGRASKIVEGPISKPAFVAMA